MSYTITGRVIKTERATGSINGNPAFFVTLETPTGETQRLRTQSDAMIGYGIQNPEYRDEWHVFELTRAGRIKYGRTVPEYLATTDGRDAGARLVHNS
jgi:hypothetical protein